MKNTVHNNRTSIERHVFKLKLFDALTFLFAALGIVFALIDVCVYYFIGSLFSTSLKS
jgi:hypothetical protein